jgi:hypothetical protein
MRMAGSLALLGTVLEMMPLLHEFMSTVGLKRP